MKCPQCKKDELYTKIIGFYRKVKCEQCGYILNDKEQYKFEGGGLL